MAFNGTILTGTAPYTQEYTAPLNQNYQLGQPTLVYYGDINADYANTSNLPFSITDEDAVNKQIANILGTQLGTEYFEPLYGSQIPNLLFGSVSTGTAFRIQTFILTSLGNWMANRIVVNPRQTSCTADFSLPGYNVNIYYTVSYSGVPNAFRGKLRL